MSDMRWMVFESDEGTLLSDSAGYIATADEVKEIAARLVSFAESHGDYIDENNADVDSYHDELRHGIYRRDGATSRTSNGKKRYLYMFKSGKNMYKIGVTADVERRLKELNDRPYPVKLFAVSDVPFYRAFEVEREMHEIHKDDRINGEWFEIDDERAELTACIIKYADDDYENGRSD